MKKSNKVVLTALFFAAISSATAKAQEVNVSANQQIGKSDSSIATQPPINPVVIRPVFVHHSFWWSIFHRNPQSRNVEVYHQPAVIHPTTSTAVRRSGGFGNSMRISSSSGRS